MLRSLFILAFLSFSLAAQTAKEQLILQTQNLMQQGELKAARQLITQAQKKYPNDAGFDNLLGIIEAQQNNFMAAEAAFKRAIARNPKFTGAALNLGRLYQENTAQFVNAPKQALQIYLGILRYDPAHTEANYQCAVLLQLLGNFQTSLLHAGKLPAEFQQSAQFYALLCGNFAGLENRAKADEYAAKLISHADFNEADALSIWSVLENKKREDLLLKFSEALQPKLSPEIFHRVGLLYEKLGQFAQAREAMEKSSAGGKPSTGLLMDLTRIAHRQKDFRRALSYLAHARDLEPRNAAIHFSFGMICAEMNLGAEAQSAFAKALELAPNNPDYNYAMGLASSYRHDPGEALPYLQKFLQLKPNDPHGKLLIGSVYFKTKDYESARRELMIAVKNSATAPQAHFYLGRVARQENKLDEAINELTLAIQLNAKNADAYAELGQCYLQKKEYEKSSEALQTALAIDANNYAANFNLLTLYSRTKDSRETEQTKKFEEVKNKRQEQMQEFLRVIEIRPEK